METAFTNLSQDEDLVCTIVTTEVTSPEILELDHSMKLEVDIYSYCGSGVMLQFVADCGYEALTVRRKKAAGRLTA